MHERQIQEVGMQYLEQIEVPKSMKSITSKLIDYQFDNELSDERKIWLSCILAFKAVSAGNFGVGALLTSREGTIVAYGHNEVFSPYFRSDRHAEMVVLSRFEEEHRRTRTVGAFSLYTSLEPCPMCLARLITSGIGTIKYAAADPMGGMVHNINKLPDVWLELSAKRAFTPADCSASLSEMAKEIFLLTASELNRKLERRCI
jgi:cytosine deaminase